MLADNKIQRLLNFNKKMKSIELFPLVEKTRERNLLASKPRLNSRQVKKL